MVRASGGDVYVGGVFDWVDGVAVKNVARWDGKQWHAVGEGLTFAVRAMAFDEQGVLYAGGGFVGESGHTLARLEGGEWKSVDGIDGPVQALAQAPGGGVYAGGMLGKVGAAELPQMVARYDGKAWAAVASGDKDGNGSVGAILPGKSGAVCVGGLFAEIEGAAANNVACWDGKAWAQSGDGLPGEVMRLLRHADGALYAAGTFTFVINPDTGDYVAGMGRYDEAKKVWVPFEGVDGGFINTVRALATEPGGGLLIGGLFAQAGQGASGAAARSLARFKDGAWSELGGGITAAVGAFDPSVTGAYELIPSSDGIYAAGFFSEVGGRPSISVARIDKDGKAVPLTADLKMHQGLDGFVDAVAVDGQGRVLVGGGFQHAGPLEAAGVARWLGEGWEPVGKGIDGVVRVLREDKSGMLWAGGEMFLKGPKVAASVARFEEGDWKLAGKPLDGPVFAITPDSAGRILIGGDFTANTDGVALGHVAVWSGTDWGPVGALCPAAPAGGGARARARGARPGGGPGGGGVGRGGDGAGARSGRAGVRRGAVCGRRQRAEQPRRGGARGRCMEAPGGRAGQGFRLCLGAVLRRAGEAAGGRAVHVGGGQDDQQPGAVEWLGVRADRRAAGEQLRGEHAAGRGAARGGRRGVCRGDLLEGREHAGGGGGVARRRRLEGAGRGAGRCARGDGRGGRGAVGGGPVCHRGRVPVARDRAV